MGIINDKSNVQGGDALIHVMNNLRPYQIEGLNFLIKKRKSLVFDDMG
jgi:hypothetical protein